MNDLYMNEMFIPKIIHREFFSRLFHAKLGYYLLQQLLKLKMLYSIFVLISPYVLKNELKNFIKIHFLIPYNLKSHVEIQINRKINYKI